MKYALGNMLNGAGGFNPDGLSLDLQFAADKTLTARKGPTPVFTRGTSATQVGASGLIEYAPENLILQSEDFANTSWLKTNVSVSADTEVAPNGELTADTVSITTIGGNNLRNASVITVTPLTTYTFSFWVKRGTATDLRYSAFDNTGGVNIINPTSYYAQTSASVWTRVSITLTTPAGCTGLTIYPLRDGNSTGTVFLWGAQLEHSSTARAYIPTTTAAVYAPRFDHDPMTLDCKGLLIEESRTNLVSFSDAFNDASWGKASTGIAAPVVTANQGTAPDGQNTADRIVFAASTAAEQQGHVWKIAAGGDQNAGSSVTVSVWLRTETGTATVYLSIVTPAGSTYIACSVTTTWTRFEVTRTLPSTTRVYMEIGPDTKASVNQPPAPGATVLVWGAQLEAGSFATSYIPTTSSALTRSADFCSITGSAFSGMWQSATEATILLEANASIMAATTGGNRGIATLSNGVAYSNQIGFFKEAGTDFIKGRTPSGDLIQVQNSLGKFKGAIAIASSAAGCFNGAAPSASSDTIGTVNRLTFADPTLASSGHPSVWVSRFQIYRKRLPNAKLQSLTAP